MGLELVFGLLLGLIVGLVGFTVLFGVKRRQMDSEMRIQQEALTQFQVDNAALKERAAASDQFAKEIKAQAEEIISLRESESSLRTQMTEREKAYAEKIAVYESAKAELSKQFAEISQSSLEKNNKLFLDLAQQSFESQKKQASQELNQKHELIDKSVKGIFDTLEKLGEHNHSLESKRVSAYSGLMEQVKMLSESQSKLQRETQNLVGALKAPSQRGRWGEIQLKRVVEMAGMLEYCDFEQQVSVDYEETRLRPDLIVKLPNAKQIIVDSKVALDAYLDASQLEDDDLRKVRLVDHSRQVRKHITQLSAKSYWNQFESTPEFVVMFLPNEPIFSAALEQDPQLIEFGAENRVLIATPVTLIALLRAVAYGWSQERIAQSAQEISKMAQELYGRVGTLAEHFSKLGSNLDRSIRSYNDAVGSMERMVLPQIRKLKDQGIVASNEVPVLEPLDKVSRELQAPELRSASSTELVAEV
jgi:DNA recombination protein RmuC